jgi:hypothetical protein
MKSTVCGHLALVFVVLAADHLAPYSCGCLQIISALYCVIAIFSFENVLDVYNEINNIKGHQLWAFLAATLLAPAMVMGFFLFGTFTLMFSTISEAGLTYAFGAMHVSCLWMAALVLHSAVSIHAYKDDMKVWEKTGGAAPKRSC